MAPNNDPKKPSQDFFGEILGAIRCLPSVAPTIYPKVSEATMPKTVITTSQAPSSTCNSVIPKQRKNGNHKIASMVVGIDETGSAGSPTAVKNTVNEILINKAHTIASTPPNHAATGIPNSATQAGV